MGVPEELGDFFAVVPAGGAGTRLWPLSRQGRPKFLLDLAGEGSSLLAMTWQRLVPLTSPERITVVTGQAHAEAVRAELPQLQAANLLVEPTPRDSMAAIGLAAAVLHERHGNVLLGSFAADHLIRRPNAFHTAIRHACLAARQGYLVTIGIEAHRPATGFGYIRTGAPLQLAQAPQVHLASEFTEKPDAETAAAYLASGQYRWNAGMFVATTKFLLDRLAELLPALHDGLRDIARAWDGAHRNAVVERVWPGLHRIAIDHALAEPLAARGQVAVVPADLGWDDIGDFTSLSRVVPGGQLGAAAVIRMESPDAFVAAEDRLVAVLGVPGAVIVDTPDALLVTTTHHAQDVKDVVAQLPSELR